MKYSVTHNGRTQQGWSSFDAAVDLVVEAHEAGEEWHVTVHDGTRPRRIEEVPESIDFVNAVLERMLAREEVSR